MSAKHRQLAAIVFTDIVGYSAMMQQDETRANRVRERHRLVFDELTEQYGGRILQYYGDGTLSIFQSAVAAVECSVEMQKAFREEPLVPLRIGIHTGDITFSKEEVYGDGLNLASRIESACMPGGIFISGKVYDDIKNHQWLTAKMVGEFEFKNIKHALSLYAINTEGLAVPQNNKLSYLKQSKAKVVNVRPSGVHAPATPRSLALKFREGALWMLTILALLLIGMNFLNKKAPPPVYAGPLDGQIAIAVLPFSNFSGDEEDQYFSDGITEDILTLLSGIKDVRVISRTSVMQYKNTNKTIPEIAAELHATHILEGSVRKSGNKVRVVAQLIDAISDAHVWAHTYDKEMTELFEIQSNVAQDIAQALEHELSPSEWASINKKPTNNLEAYEHYLKGREFYEKYDSKDNESAIQHFKKALDLDTSFALAYAGLGDAISQKANYEKKPMLLDSAAMVSQKAIGLDKKCSEAYKSLGLAYHYKGDDEKALAAYQRAVEENPNNDMAISNMAMIHSDKGEYVEGFRWAKKAFDLNPKHPMALKRLSELTTVVGMDDEAEALLKGGIESNPEHVGFYQELSNLYIKQNKFAEAEELGQKIMDMEPDGAEGPLLMANVHLMEEDFEKAHQFFTTAKEREGRKKEAKHVWEAELGIALTEMKIKKDEKARHHLEGILVQLEDKMESSRPHPKQLFLKSIIEASMGETEAALQTLETAVDNNFIDVKMVVNNPVFAQLKESNNEAFLLISDKLKKKVNKMKVEVQAIQ